MAASPGFEPGLLVPETSVLPIRRQGTKKHRILRCFSLVEENTTKQPQDAMKQVVAVGMYIYS